jgi:hypothetical protein
MAMLNNQRVNYSWPTINKPFGDAQDPAPRQRLRAAVAWPPQAHNGDCWAAGLLSPNKEIHRSGYLYIFFMIFMCVYNIYNIYIFMRRIPFSPLDRGVGGTRVLALIYIIYIYTYAHTHIISIVFPASTYSCLLASFSILIIVSIS